MTDENAPAPGRMSEILSRRARYLSLLGRAITAVGAVWLLVRVGFLLTASPAHGVVEAVEPIRDGSFWRARFTYSDQEGRPHRAETTFLSPTLCPSITVGNSVAVRYSPDKPGDALILTAGTLWVAPGALVALGLFFAGGGRLLRLFASLGRSPKGRPPQP
jgi:hypothetical protein